MTERDAFEEWARTAVWLNVTRQKSSPHLYESREAQLAWMAWQDRASKGELATRPKIALKRLKPRTPPPLRERHQVSLDMLRSVQWGQLDIQDGQWRFRCPKCNALEQDGHTDSCPIGRLLG